MTFPACGLSLDGRPGPARSSCLALTSVQPEKRKKKSEKSRRLQGTRLPLSAAYAMKVMGFEEPLGAGKNSQLISMLHFSCELVTFII